MDNYNAEDWVHDHLIRLFRFDAIRVSKLFEIAQYTILTFFLSWISAAIINSFCAKYAHNLDNYTNMQLIWVILMATVMIVLFGYYLVKVTVVIPMLFPVGGGFIPSKKGEDMNGSGIAMGLIFYSQIFNYYTLVNELGFRLLPGYYRYNKPSSV